MCQNEVKTISLNDIWICLDEFKLGKYGVHFVGLNGGNTLFWELWLKSTI